MGALGRLFSGLFGFLFASVGQYISAKLLIVVAAIAAFVAMLAALTVLFNAALVSISMTMPSEFTWGLGLIPSNVPACVSAIIAGRLAIWLFQVKFAIVKLKVQS